MGNGSSHSRATIVTWVLHVQHERGTPMLAIFRALVNRLTVIGNVACARQGSQHVSQRRRDVHAGVSCYRN